MASRRRSALPRLLPGIAVVILLALNPADLASAGAKPFTRFSVYFSNQRLSQDPTDCGAVFPVPREVPETRAVARAALEQLFRGPTPEEKAHGYHSFFSPQTATLLEGIAIDGGTAYVDLHDSRAALSGATSSCGSAEFISQVEATLEQFPAVERVVFAIEGDPSAFYEWIELECAPTNHDCDPRRFLRPD